MALFALNHTTTRMLSLLLLTGSALADPPGTYCTGGPSKDAQSNTYPVQAPAVEHVRDVAHGRLFKARHELGNHTFPILHLYGTPYQQGFAQGTLLKQECIKMWDAFWDFLVKDAVNETELVAMLKGVEADSKSHIPEHFTTELEGLANATGYSYQKILWLHLYPETTDGHCSMFGAWGKATESTGGKLLQLRALDYITADFLSLNHALTVYHPLPSDGHPFVNIGFVGTISAVTGMSAAPLALSEIGVSNPDFSFGPQRNGQGIPFNIMLRDLIQRDSSLQHAKHRIQNAERTVDLILGVGDGNENKFTGVQYSAQHARFYNDTNLLPVNSTWHHPIEDVVYQGMDWLCPEWTSLLGEQLLKYHGKITPELTIREITSIVQTGNLHIAVYDIDVDRQILYLSHSSAGSTASAGSPRLAYERPFMKFDARSLYDVKAPCI